MRGCTTTADEVHSIDAAYLRRYGYFGWGMREGTLNWSRGGEVTEAVSVTVSTGKRTGWSESFMDLRYTCEGQGSTVEELCYRVELLPTDCAYGGRRWWFQCPNGRCKRRVRILYKSGSFFVCRKCASLWYDSQRYVNRGCRPMLNLYKGDRLFETLKRRYYRGRPTRNYRRYLKLVAGIDPLEAQRSFRAVMLGPQQKEVDE